VKKRPFLYVLLAVWVFYLLAQTANAAADIGDTATAASADVAVSAVGNLASNTLLSDPEISTNSVEITEVPGQPIQRSPLRDAGTVAPAIAHTFAAQLNGQQLNPIAVPAEILKVNQSVEQIVLLARSPALPQGADGMRAVSLGWVPRIYGVTHESVLANGCSDIPVHEDYGVLIRFEVSLTVDYQDAAGVAYLSKPLLVGIDDQSPVNVKTRCWKRQGGHNVPQEVQDPNWYTHLAAHWSKIHDSLVVWLAANHDDFDDLILVRLAVAKAADGQMKFDGSTYAATLKTNDQFTIRWTFIPDEGARLATAAAAGAGK
jgi:hypothetical protein